MCGVIPWQKVVKKTRFHGSVTRPRQRPGPRPAAVKRMSFRWRERRRGRERGRDRDRLFVRFGCRPAVLRRNDLGRPYGVSHFPDSAERNTASIMTMLLMASSKG